MKLEQVAVGIVLLCAAAGFAEPVESPINIPYVPRLQADGDASDWAGNGYRIEVMSGASGNMRDRKNLAPSARLAWDKEGLWALVAVTDDAILESPDAHRLGDKDSVELLVSGAPGDPAHYRLQIAPGVTAESPSLRVDFSDHRNHTDWPPLKQESASKRTTDGYQIEVKLPWSNLHLSPKQGDTLAVQLVVNDQDAVGGKYQACWCVPKGITNPWEQLYPIRLQRKPSSAERLCVSSSYDGKGAVDLEINALPECIGREARILRGHDVVATVPLAAREGYASGTYSLSLTRLSYEKPETLQIVAGQSEKAALFLKDRTAARDKLLITAEIACSASVFFGEELPTFSLNNRELFERLFGPYTLSPTFYDANYQVVKEAAKPGRYGAVVDVRFADGHSLRRFQTVFRSPAKNDAFFWLVYKPEISAPLPEIWGADLSSGEAQATALGRQFRNLGLGVMNEDWHTAALAAGLFEAGAPAAKATVYNDAWAADRQWWVTLKRKLYGTDKEFAKPFVCPRPVEGAPATVLHEGTLEQAGATAEGVQALDALCREWVAASKEPMTVCLARHGVVFFHQAYGERNGQPHTVDTKTWMASISKMMSGVLMMMLVDQGLVDLDAPIDTYLPRFRGVHSGSRPMVVRECYTHTNGLALDVKHPMRPINHWGDEMHDYEEQIAEYYPFIKPGNVHAYNGCGYALGGKIMEAVTGEALPQLFEKHYIGPLGCAHSDCIDGSALSFSTAMDMARIAQMVLNKGAYGPWRFFSEQTYEKMLPVNLSPWLRAPASTEWGIGLVYSAYPGLGKKAFGHGAASGAGMLVDPEKDLVATMTRNRPGEKYGEFQPKFMAAIAACLKQ